MIVAVLGLSMLDKLYNYYNIYMDKYLPPANEVCEGYVFTPVCQSFCSQGRHAWLGVCMVGGHAWLQGACVVAGGHAWLWRGACVFVGGHAWLPGGYAWLWGVWMVLGGVHGCGGCAWLQGACMVEGGMHGCGEVCVVAGGGVRGIRRDTVNERAVRILLECIPSSISADL